MNTKGMEKCCHCESVYAKNRPKNYVNTEGIIWNPTGGRTIWSNWGCFDSHCDCAMWFAMSRNDRNSSHFIAKKNMFWCDMCWSLLTCGRASRRLQRHIKMCTNVYLVQPCTRARCLSKHPHHDHHPAVPRGCQGRSSFCPGLTHSVTHWSLSGIMAQEHNATFLWPSLPFLGTLHSSYIHGLHLYMYVYNAFTRSALQYCLAFTQWRCQPCMGTTHTSGALRVTRLAQGHLLHTWLGGEGGARGSNLVSYWRPCQHTTVKVKLC